MNCTRATGLFDTSAVPPASAAGAATPRASSNKTGPSFGAILGAQDDTDSGPDRRQSDDTGNSSFAVPVQTRSDPFPRHILKAGEYETPISLHPQEGQRLESSQVSPSDGRQIESRATKAFRQEQTESTRESAQDDAPAPDATPVSSGNSPSDSVKSEEPAVSDAAAPSDPAAKSVLASLLVAVSPETLAAADGSATRELATGSNGAINTRDRIHGAQAAEGNPVFKPMQTALEGVLTLATEAGAPVESAGSAQTPDAAINLLKSAEASAVNHRASDSALASTNLKATQVTTADAAMPAQAAETAAQTASSVSNALPKPAAARSTNEHEEEPTPQRTPQSNVTVSEAPRVQASDAPVRTEAVRPTPGVEMTQRIEAIQTAQSAARTPVQSFSIPIGSESNPLATLRLVQQATGVRLTVQTSDAALSQSMQANLPQLIRGLEESGIKSEFQARPEITAQVSTAPARTASTDNRQANSFSQDGSQQDGPAHGQGREKRQPSHEWRQWLQHGRKQTKERN
ncbi:hypothetical protein [uncultured Paludibaculum sp.]|uniref:hypothetical protein n=1 Tax=uncultured Paludibaculum sp. TaxID=1765020 RepID=UPI002AAA666C|nr:hypothetical protein [uncultured Paludibaculum sp.]